MLPIFISTILQSVRKENLAHYFPYDVKLRLLADSRSFLANQKARNAIVGAENLLIIIICDLDTLSYTIQSPFQFENYLTNRRFHASILLLIDQEFRHSIVKVAVDPRGDSRVDRQTNLTML